MKRITGKYKKIIFIVLISLCIYSSLVSISDVFFNFKEVFTIIGVRLILMIKDFQVSWEKSSSQDYIRKIAYSFAAFLIYFPLGMAFGEPNTLFLLADFSIFTLVLIASVSFKKSSNTTKKGTKKYTIYGAGSAGIYLYNNILGQGGRVKCFIDDDPKTRQNSIDGVKVISLDSFLSNEHFMRVDEIIIAIPSLTKEEIYNKYEQLQSVYNGVIKILPPLDQMLSDRPLIQQIENISLDNYLARNVRGIEQDLINDFISGKTVLISGAGGTIGSELARQVIASNAKLIILLDHSEFNLYQISDELSEHNIVSILLSVTDQERLGHVFQQYAPEVVLHAAAYKHVPLCEENVNSAIENNIVGTMNIVNHSIRYGVSNFVLISTDKAVRPTNVMGATKRICELYGQNIDSNKTKIISVRFGNVLGSSGSVIPKFIKQINSGGPITVTHREITRYFMLTSEACGLVLQAATEGKGGEIFILDMGEPVNIYDLAKKMVAMSGNKNLSIKVTGLRPGEKLYEELIIDDAVERAKCEQIMIAQKTNFPIKSLSELIEKLLKTDNKLLVLKEIVPEFNHMRN